MKSSSIEIVYHDKLKDFDFKLKQNGLINKENTDQNNNLIKLQNKIKQKNE